MNLPYRGFPLVIFITSENLNGFPTPFPFRETPPQGDGD